MKTCISPCLLVLVLCVTSQLLVTSEQSQTCTHHMQALVHSEIMSASLTSHRLELTSTLRDHVPVWPVTDLNSPYASISTLRDHIGQSDQSQTCTHHMLSTLRDHAGLGRTKLEFSYQVFRFNKAVRALYQSLAWECKVGLGRPTASTTAMDSPLPLGNYWPASGGSREIVRKRLSLSTRVTWVLFRLVGKLPGWQSIMILGLVPRN